MCNFTSLFYLTFYYILLSLVLRIQRWKQHSICPIFKSGNNLGASKWKEKCSIEQRSIGLNQTVCFKMLPSDLHKVIQITSFQNLYWFIFKIDITSTLLILQILSLKIKCDNGSKSYYYSIYLLFTKKSTITYVKILRNIFQNGIAILQIYTYLEDLYQCSINLNYLSIF